MQVSENACPAACAFAPTASVPGGMLIEKNKF